MIWKYKCWQLGLYRAGEHDNEDNINKKDNRDSNHNSIGNKDKVNEDNENNM